MNQNLKSWKDSYCLMVLLFNTPDGQTISSIGTGKIWTHLYSIQLYPQIVDIFGFQRKL